jgi:hypothetical protein
VRGLADPAQVLHRRPEVAQHPCAGDLLLQVVEQAVAADDRDVAGRPACRGVAELAELRRQHLRVTRAAVGVGVDAFHERGRDTLGGRPVRQPLRVHVAPVEEQACRTVTVDELGPEHLRQQPEAATTPQVELEETFPRRVEPLRTKQVVLRPGVQVRHAGLVDEHLDRRPQSGHREVF